MPSTESQGQQPGEHIGGVGSLPGSKDEQGVAVLPEERATKVTETVPQEHHDELGAPPKIPEKSPGISGVGIGGATDPLKRETQSNVRAYFVPASRSTPVDPEAYTAVSPPWRAHHPA